MFCCIWGGKAFLFGLIVELVEISSIFVLALLFITQKNNKYEGGSSVLYQEEHSGLHDLPGQLHQDALFDKALEHKHQ